MVRAKRYRTKLTRQGLCILLGQIGVVLGTVAFWRVGAWPMVVLGGLVLCLATWILLGTRYLIGDSVLDARRGPIRIRVPLRDVTGLHRHALDRGVTLGFGPDFIGIEYGANAINVSPRDADDFIRALQAAMPARIPPRTIPRASTPPHRPGKFRNPVRLVTRGKDLG